jgi:hypothetical protein
LDVHRDLRSLHEKIGWIEVKKVEKRLMVALSLSFTPQQVGESSEECYRV